MQKGKTENGKRKNGGSDSKAKIEAKHASNTEQRIAELLEKVRPYIRMHGGDVQFLKYEHGNVSLRITGACAHCSLADLTYNNLVAGLLKDEVPEIREIIIEK